MAAKKTGFKPGAAVRVRAGDRAGKVGTVRNVHVNHAGMEVCMVDFKDGVGLEIPASGLGAFALNAKKGGAK